MDSQIGNNLKTYLFVKSKSNYFYRKQYEDESRQFVYDEIYKKMIYYDKESKSIHEVFISSELRYQAFLDAVSLYKEKPELFYPTQEE